MKRQLMRMGWDQKGLLIIEYTVMTALFIGVMLPALALIADQMLDILNDLAEELDMIDDFVADLDLEVMPESNEDTDPDDLGPIPI